MSSQNIFSSDTISGDILSTNQISVAGTADFFGNVNISENLTVEGSTTTIDTINVAVKDHNIELAVTDSPSDSTANGGGIILKGDSDKNLLWNSSSNAWESNVGLNIISGKVGIGTTSPSQAAKLHVSGGVGLFQRDSSSTGPTNTISLRNNDASDGIQMGLDFQGLDATQVLRTAARIGCVIENHETGSLGSRLYFAGNGASADMTIDSDGNVGIGTTSPDFLLDLVQNGGGVQLQMGRSNTNPGTAWMGADINGFHLGVGEYAAAGGNVGDPNGFTVSAIGNVGIGTATPSSKLEVDGDIKAAGDVIAFSASDQRLKNNISNITNPISKLNQINGVNFEWSKDQSIHSGKDVGVIAQDVQKVLPEVVTERQDGNLAVKYEKIIPLLVEAIKDQQKQIEELKKKLS